MEGEEDQDYYDEFADDGDGDDDLIATLSALENDQKEREREQEKEREREREGEDDQHKQKLTSQLEALQDNLRQSEEEKEKTQIRLAEATVKIEELTARNSSLLSTKKELEEAKERISELQEELKQAKKTPPPPVTSPSPPQSYERLMKTFLQVSNQHNLDNSVVDIEDMNESICISLLQQLSKKFQQEKQLKKTPSVAPAPSPSMANASDSELQQRIINLEEELRLALGAAEDIRALKAKAISLVERIRLEKEEKLRCEAEQKVYIKKIEMLSDHVEKLMIHLKHEAAAKIKAIDQLRASEKRNESSQLQLGIISRKVAAKDRLIAELREGSKILEDQLRLMDEKYLELRTKLDYAREVAAKKVKIAQKTASDLRVKFALAGNTKLLDHVPLPDINSGNTGNAMGDFQLSDEFMRSMPNFSQSMTMSSPQPLQLRSLNSSNNLKPSTTGGMGMSTGASTREKKKSKKKSQTIAKDTEQSTERVLDKIRRLRGGQQEWTEEKIRNLVKSH